MNDQSPDQNRGVESRPGQPLLIVPVEENGHWTWRYFFSTAEAAVALGPARAKHALQAVGAWSDLDWDGMQAELDRIRHEDPPSTPADFDLN